MNRFTLFALFLLTTSISALLIKNYIIFPTPQKNSNSTDSDAATMESFLYTQYNKTGLQWKISADHAIQKKDSQTIVLRGHVQNTLQQIKPYYIYAKEALYHKDSRTIIYSGHVHLAQDEIQAYGDQMTVKVYKKTNELKHIIITGNLAHFNTVLQDHTPVHTEAKIIQFFPLEKKIVLMQQAKIIKGKLKLISPLIFYYFKPHILYSKKTKNRDLLQLAIKAKSKNRVVEKF